MKKNLNLRHVALASLFTLCLTGVLFLGGGKTVHAKITTLDDGTRFDSDFYSDAYPDLKQAFGNDYQALLTHYLTYGREEGRVPSGGVVLNDGTVFDAFFYASTYPDLKQAFGYNYDALLNHYLTYGKAEGRTPSGDLGSIIVVPIDPKATDSVASTSSNAVVLDDGTVFDAAFYASTYPDLKQAFGNDYDALLNHYLTYGKAEGRIPSAEAGTVGAVLATQKTPEQTGLVSIENLENKKSLKKKCTNEEFQAAYDAAVSIVTPLIGLSREDQLVGIATAIRAMYDSGQVAYSTSAAHYNDPYGYFVSGVGSCAGCTRATGLCLNMLGISYEHVHENEWRHQWCRVNINGVYWICDAYGLYTGPELEPYKHPRSAQYPDDPAWQ